MLVECGQLKIKKTNCKAMNKDAVWLNVGSSRRFNQPNLTSKKITSQRLQYTARLTQSGAVLNSMRYTERSSQAYTKLKRGKNICSRVSIPTGISSSFSSVLVFTLELRPSSFSRKPIPKLTISWHWKQDRNGAAKGKLKEDMKTCKS